MMNVIRKFSRYCLLFGLTVHLSYSRTYSQIQIQVSPELKSFNDPEFSHQKYPMNILKMDPYFTHHVIVAEKSNHTIHLFGHKDGRPVYIKSFPMATGKIPGDKTNQGDHKTPEGIYHLTDFLPEDELMSRFGKAGEIYGRGAFVLDFPNPLDSGKSGSGIWLHSTNIEDRILKGMDSRGCVVVSNQHLAQLGEYIDLNHTMMIIVHDMSFLREKTWNKNLSKLEDTMNTWLSAWRKKDFAQYISFYDKSYADRSRKSYAAFSSYKKSVFSNHDTPSIELKHFSILSFNNYAVVQFEQKYKSHSIDDSGKKTLYLKIDSEYNWKIVSELWHKLPTGPRMAFIPKQRFLLNDRDRAEFKENETASSETRRESNLK